MTCKVADQQVEAHTLITTHGVIVVGQQLIHIGEDHQEFLEKVLVRAVLYSAAAISVVLVCSAVQQIPAAAMPAAVLTGI